MGPILNTQEGLLKWSSIFPILDRFIGWLVVRKNALFKANVILRNKYNAEKYFLRMDIRDLRRYLFKTSCAVAAGIYIQKLNEIQLRGYTGKWMPKLFNSAIKETYLTKFKTMMKESYAV